MSSATRLASRREFLHLGTNDSDPESLDVPQTLGVASSAPPATLAGHVANRLMFGPKPGDVAAIEAQGVDAWLSEQLSPTSADTPELATALAALPSATISESTTQLYDRRYLEYWQARLPADETYHITIARMLHSKWQLREMMVEFWHNHFNVYAFDSPIMSLWTEWDQLIRQHAFGNFRAFLEATSKHPVMLHYLDNYLSTNAGPNENFSRELFELHTLGSHSYNAPGGYIDEDVYEASRCFTGWTYERTRTDPNRGKFKYIRENHDRFQKVVLGAAIPRDQADLADGLLVLDLLCNHLGTASHIALKLCRRFISDDPPASIVESAAAVFHANTTSPNQIELTLRHIFNSAEFRDVANRGVKFKRPFDWTISAMRALNIPYLYWETEEDSFSMTHMMNSMGHSLFAWRSPDGPPDSFFDWATTNNLLRRCNFVFQIDAGWWDDDGLVFPALGLVPPEVQTARQLCQWWIDRLIQRPVSESTFESLLVFAAEGRNYDLPLPQAQINDKVARLAALCTVTPEFMWR